MPVSSCGGRLVGCDTCGDFLQTSLSPVLGSSDMKNDALRFNVESESVLYGIKGPPKVLVTAEDTAKSQTHCSSQ